jgi:hypothetical protein
VTACFFLRLRASGKVCVNSVMNLQLLETDLAPWSWVMKLFLRVQEHLCFQKHISLKPWYLSQFLILLITLGDFCEAFTTGKHGFSAVMCSCHNRQGPVSESHTYLILKCVCWLYHSSGNCFASISLGRLECKLRTFSL